MTRCAAMLARVTAGDRDSGACAPQQRESSPRLVVLERGSQPELVQMVHGVERAGREPGVLLQLEVGAIVAKIIFLYTL